MEQRMNCIKKLAEYRKRKMLPLNSYLYTKKHIEELLVDNRGGVIRGPSTIGTYEEMDIQ